MKALLELKKMAQNLSVLYVEDDESIRESFAKYLRLIFDTLDVVEDGEEGLEAFRSREYDLVITDIHMPKMSGLEMIKHIREESRDQEVIITTAFSDIDYMLEAISLNVNGYILKPLNFDKMNQALYDSVQKRALILENENYKINLEELVKERTEQNIALQKEKIENYEKTLLSLVEMVERRDAYTGGHSLRVAKYSKLIADDMGYDKESSELLYRAGILHDIGKVETPDAVLLKPSALDKLEYGLIREHVVTSYELLQKIPMYEKIAQIVKSHHERYDGGGYPDGLRGDEIPELSRVLVVADAFDAMTTNRIYKPRMSIDSAITELHSLSNIQFDERVVKSAIKVLKGIEIDEDIIQLPSNKMEDKRFAYFFEDQVTHAYNKNYLDLMLIQNDENMRYMRVLLLKNFNDLNKKYGWEGGNNYLKKMSIIIREYCENALIFRVHGDDFVIISEEKIVLDGENFKTLLDEFNNIVTIEQKEFNISEENISSFEEFENILKKSL